MNGLPLTLCQIWTGLTCAFTSLKTTPQEVKSLPAQVEPATYLNYPPFFPQPLEIVCKTQQWYGSYIDLCIQFNDISIWT